MIAERKNILRLDWVIILVYFLLLGFGIGNILSSSISGEEINIFDFSTLYGKQFLYALISLFFGFIAISIEVKFYERFSSIFYILSITTIAPRFGVGNAIFFVLLGQLISAAVIDHLALFGSSGSPFTMTRAFGLGFMAVGIWFTQQT